MKNIHLANGKTLTYLAATFIALFTSILLTACTAAKYTTVMQPPELPLTDTSKTILVIDNITVNTSGLIGIKKKETIVTSIKKDFLQHLTDTIKNNLHVTVVIDSAITITQTDAQALAVKHNAAYIIVLNNFYEGFDRGIIEKEKDANGTVTKMADYDIYCETKADIYDSAGTRMNKTIRAQRFYTRQSTPGALFDIGPSFKGATAELRSIAFENALQTLNLFHQRKAYIRAQ